MIKKKDRSVTEVNSSSMADIAFLLLIFFLVTTTIVNERGLPITLPQKVDENVEVDIIDRNVFKVIVNSNDDLLVEGERMNLADVRKNCVEFLSNNGKLPSLSDSPEEAIVSYKTDRGTSYEMYIRVLDELKAAYHELRAKEVGITVEDYLKLNSDDRADKVLLGKAQKAYPMQLSEAEPTNVGSY